MESKVKQSSFRGSPAKLPAHSSRIQHGFWDHPLVRNAYILVSILLLVIIGTRLYHILPDLLPIMMGVSNSQNKQETVASFRFDDNFDNLTPERKEEYLDQIAHALNVEKLDLKGFRRGSVIVDINVDDDTAQRLARERQDIANTLGAEVDVSGFPGDRHHHHHHHGQFATKTAEPAEGVPIFVSDDDTIVLQSGDHIETDRGLFALAKVSGLVFHDIDANGIFDASIESGVEGVRVLFVRANGEVVAERLTDRAGQYHFSEKEPGEYYVSIQAPPGRMFSPLLDLTTFSDYAARAGHSRSRIIKSEVDPAKNGNSSVFSLHSGSKSTELNAGIYGPAVISGYVWEDILGNGRFDASVSREEQSLQDSYVELLSVTDSNDIVASLPLIANGRFIFENVVPGTYSLRFSLPPDHYFVLSTLNTGILNIVSDGNRSVDVGFYRPVSVQGSIFEDLNAMGWVTGKETEARRHIRGATVRLVAEHSETRNNNKYLIENGHPITAESLVSPNGEFSFEGFAPGAYHLYFLPPQGYKLSQKLRASELAEIQVEDPGALGSDADPNTGLTPSYIITSGTHLQKIENGIPSDINVCMYTLATIGGYIWEDLNANGIFDEEFEHTLEGVEVHLLNSDGSFIGKTITNERGHYLFRGLEPGRYMKPRLVPPPNHQASNARVSFQYVTADNPRLQD